MHNTLLNDAEMVEAVKMGKKVTVGWIALCRVALLLSGLMVAFLNERTGVIMNVVSAARELL